MYKIYQTSTIKCERATFKRNLINMRYDQMKEFNKYTDIYDYKWKQLTTVEENRTYVVFFDGKNATKGHNRDIIAPNGEGYTYHCFQTAKDLVKKMNAECYIFAIMDEVVLIFPQGIDLILAANEDERGSILSLLAIRFYKEFIKYEECEFKGYIYEIPTKDIQRTIDLRRMCGYYTALEYYAKEYMHKKCWKDKNADEIIENLKQQGLYDGFIQNTAFHQGLYEHILPKPTVFDDFFSK